MGRLRAISASLLAFAAAGCSHPAHRLDVVPLPQIDPSSDYGKGVSALAAGDIYGTLIAAGGANFPDIPAAEGGKKRFYDEIYILAEGSDTWESFGRLPEPSAYGAVFQLEDRIIIAGGAGASGSQAGVTELRLFQGGCDDEYYDSLRGPILTVETIGALPKPIEQAAAAHDGQRLYIAGGLSNGEPSTGVYRCDLSSDSPDWEKIAELPEPMVQPIAAVYGDRFYVWGGFDPVKKYAADYGYCWSDGQWRRIAGLPDGGTAVGSTAVQQHDGRLWVVGGVNREVFNRALNLPPDRNAEYLSQPADYYRFRTKIMTFDPVTGQWKTAGSTPSAARAGAAVILNADRQLTIINGEEKPGIRSAEINAAELPIII